MHAWFSNNDYYIFRFFARRKYLKSSDSRQIGLKYSELNLLSKCCNTFYMISMIEAVTLVQYAVRTKYAERRPCAYELMIGA